MHIITCWNDRRFWGSGAAKLGANRTKTLFPESSIMNEHEAQKPKLTERLRHEVVEYAFNVLYLTLVFAAFIIFGRLVLASHGIIYTNYWIALIQGLVLGKVIMIGGLFRVGRWLEDRTLIYPTIYKTALFTILVGVFKVFEAAIVGWWSGAGFAGGLAKYLDKGHELILAHSLVVFVALFPFFAIKELSRVIGREKIAALFFRKRD